MQIGTRGRSLVIQCKVAKLNIYYHLFVTIEICLHICALWLIVEFVYIFAKQPVLVEIWNDPDNELIRSWSEKSACGPLHASKMKGMEKAMLR